MGEVSRLSANQNLDFPCTNTRNLSLLQNFFSSTFIVSVPSKHIDAILFWNHGWYRRNHHVSFGIKIFFVKLVILRLVVNFNSFYFSPVVEETPVATTEVTSEVSHINNSHEIINGLKLLGRVRPSIRILAPGSVLVYDSWTPPSYQFCTWPFLFSANLLSFIFLLFRVRLGFLGRALRLGWAKGRALRPRVRLVKTISGPSAAARTGSGAKRRG